MAKIKRSIHNKTEVEYEDAPSGFVNFYNYKEPLMKFPGGYGYIGALIFDGKTDQIQCHFCGDWFQSLPHHLAREHNMKASYYKEAVGLLQNTALVSETTRAKLIASGLDIRLQNLRKGKKKTQTEKDKISATLKRNATKSEYQNLKGTCPAQLIDRIQRIAKEKGSELKMRDFDGFNELLKKNFGSVKEACRIAGIKYRKPSQTLAHEKKQKTATEEAALNFIKEFITKFNKMPLQKDFFEQNQKYLYNKIVKNKVKLRQLGRQAYAGLDEYKKNNEKFNFTKEELLTFLKRFLKINGRKPSYSDCKRGLLPSLSKYSYHFGSWKKALKLAFKN